MEIEGWRAALLATVVGIGGLAQAAFAEGRDAQKLYAAKCALCHGKDGKPNPAIAAGKVPNFTDPAWQKSASDEAIRKSIVDGREGTLMRAFGKELSEEEVTALLRVVRAFAPAEAPK
jgi:mono/diheme cytochrome c family protein